MKIGIIALTDCSPLVIAAEKGFFAKYGLNVTVAKQASWAAIRDALSTGDIQATHMLLGHAAGVHDGPAGLAEEADDRPVDPQPQRAGDHARSRLKGKVAADPKALKPLVDEAKAAGTPMTFAVTFPPGTHAMWMRYYLGAGGINPDSDVALVTIPPPQMVANMKVGKMDGYCVGEPWNARAIADGIGFTVDHHAGNLEGSPGEGLRLHRGVRGEEPEDRQGRAQGTARRQRLARRPGAIAPSSARSSRRRTTSTARRRSSSAACRASTTTATAARSKTPTT